MSGTVTVGLDDSPESRAAAEWAVREALLRAPPSKIVHVQEPTPRYAARTSLLDLGITEQLTGTVADVLCEAAGYVGLLVPGSRAPGGPRGFMVGSVGLGIVSRAERLDIDQPDDTLPEFAFDTVARRKGALRAVHAWPGPPTPYHRVPGDAELHDTPERGQVSPRRQVPRPWRPKFPDVEGIEASRCGSAPPVLVNDSRDASLVAVCRRIRTGSLRCSHRPCHARGPAPHHRPRRGRRAQLSRRPEEENP
ncbi:universal stress protein [Streptomyces olivaceoviridis]|uniref:universal stress protein n=1 Tax=Streptomyces olivaceoviridis TaxID=1921 RepID=UPI0036A9F4F0